MKTTKTLLSLLSVASAAMTVSAKTFVIPYADNIIRIVKTEGDAAPSAKPVEVVTMPCPKSDNVLVGEGKCETETLVIETGADGAVAFRTRDGRLLLKEKAPATFKAVEYAGMRAVRSAQSFVLGEGEPIYGLGDLENLRLNQRGVAHRLMPANVGDGIPYVASVKGWSLYWDNTSPVNFSDNADAMTFESESGKDVDYYFMYGKTGDGCVKLMRTLTGEVPMVPKWVYGFWQSKERYKTQEETVSVVKRYREEGIPLDGIVQDWQYWGSNPFWNAMEFTGENFTNPKWMIDSIHKMNTKMLITIWQSFGPMTKGYRDMKEKGWLFPFGTWPDSALGHIWPPRMDYPSGAKLYDPFCAESREVYWQNLRRLYDLGIDGWWMDSTDPDIRLKSDADWQTMTTAGVPFRDVRDAFPLCCTRGVYEHVLAAGEGRHRPFILTRGACAGQQRYATSVWSGDIQSTWDMLRKQIPGGLNYSLTGNPHFNCDLGGFFAGRYGADMKGVENPSFRELYVRWTQLGAYLPMMRSHGTDVPREVYLYGKKGTPVRDALEGAIRERYTLVPYIYSTAARVTRNSESFLRPTWFDFAEDERTWNDTDTFMFGKSFLVSPINREQYAGEKDLLAKRVWKTYLPKGSSWYDKTTGERFAGGTTVEKETTIMTIPVYVRAGSVIPYGEVMQYTHERPDAPLRVVAYPGADGTFTLYEDAGDGPSFDRSVSSEIDFVWKDSQRTLTIGTRRGAFEGMPRKRTFIVSVPGATPRAITYDGSEVTVVCE